MTSQATLLTVPLGREAHCVARQFATEQVTPQKGKQVYLNTLAVYAVHSYLKWLKVETDLHQGHSWHSGMRTVFNVADLSIPGTGKLECRPVLPGEAVCELPLEARRDRIGYVAVQFGERLDKAQLLGFATVDISNSSEQILIADLQPLDTLLDFIPPNVIEQPVTTSKMPVNLSCWLQNCFEAGWQTMEALLRTEVVNLAVGVRSAKRLSEMNADDDPVVDVSAGKLIDWGMQLAGHAVVLNVKVTQRADESVKIRLRVYPAGEQTYLPPGLQLILIDEAGATRLEAQARSTDNWIQLELSGEPEERFSVRVALENVSITEDFII